MSIEKKLSYGEAIEKIEELLVIIENPETPLNTITEEVKRVMELIKFCRAEIEGFAEESNKLLESAKE